MKIWIKENELHRTKIDLSDAIFVVNVDSYIRESTRGEIVYAKKFVIWELNMPETLVNFKWFTRVSSKKTVTHIFLYELHSKS